MRKIRAYLETGFAGCAIEVIFDCVDWGWHEMTDSEEDAE